ncbi:MAG: hypothetical protein WC384_03815 [Prolixibacteraceae bacterium]|jgi:hypothetical protein
MHKFNPNQKPAMAKKNTFRLIVFILPAIVFAGCNSGIKKNNSMENKENNAAKSVAENDTIPKVTGIGGIFFFSDDPTKTKAWYNENLGLETNDYGSTFESRNANRPEEINYLQWSPFKTGNSYFAPSKKDFMINYRVQNLVGLVKKLKANGVTVLDEIET